MEGETLTESISNEDVANPLIKYPKLDEELSDVTKSKPRGKRKCIAMLMSYYGKGYFGMQVTRSEQHPGIEDVFGKLLVKAELITEDDYQSLGKIHFQRACRTDKSVSAVRQVISFKAFEVEDPIGVLNSFVPPNIKVHAFKRTTKGFDCKKWASSRIYQYLVPSFCFQHIENFTLSSARSFRASENLIARINEILLHYKGLENFLIFG